MATIKHYLFFSIIFAVALFTSCEEEILYQDIPETEISGTWELVEIVVLYPAGQRVINPANENSALIMILNDDKTYSRMQNNKGTITNDSGTWSIEHGILTLFSGEKKYIFPCRLEGKILETTANVVDPNSGFVVPVKLQFSKKNDN